MSTVLPDVLFMFANLIFLKHLLLKWHTCPTYLSRVFITPYFDRVFGYDQIPCIVLYLTRYNVSIRERQWHTDNVYLGGMRTVSISCTTPFEAGMSAVSTCALFTITPSVVKELYTVSCLTCFVKNQYSSINSRSLNRFTLSVRTWNLTLLAIHSMQMHISQGLCVSLNLIALFYICIWDFVMYCNKSWQCFYSFIQYWEWTFFILVHLFSIQPW